MATNTYNDNYKEIVFWAWYNNGKPSAAKLASIIPANEEGTYPNNYTLMNWMDDEWYARAEDLDTEVRQEFEKEVVEQKVEMLRKHAKLGGELQDLGLQWLKNNPEKITANAAVRMIKDGWELERASVGVPEALQKMLATSDDDLLNMIEAALTGEDLDLIEELDASKLHQSNQEG